MTMNYKLEKMYLFAFLLSTSIVCRAQNIFFGDTLRFDSVVTYKLLHSIDISKKYYIFTTFKDTIVLRDKDKKRLELFFNKRIATEEPLSFYVIKNKTFDGVKLLAVDYIKPLRLTFRVYVNSDDFWVAGTYPDSHYHTSSGVFKTVGFYRFLSEMIKVKEFYKNKIYAEPTDVVKKYAKKKILIEYSDSLGKTTSFAISGKQIALGNKKIKDAKALNFCLTRLDDMFYNGNDMAQLYHIEDKIKPKGTLSITVEHKDFTEILLQNKTIDSDRMMYNEKLYELIDFISNLSIKTAQALGDM